MKFFGWKQSEPSSQTKEYFALPTSSHNETEITRPQKASKSIRVTIIAVILFILFLSLFILLHIDSTPQHPEEPHLDCGSSREAALQNGCKFDPMSFSWLQPACYDSELTSEFLALKSWRWTVDRAGMEEVSLGEVMEGEHEQLYVSWEYHLLHCTYMWRKMHRAVLAGRPVDDYIGNYNHTAHCEKMLMENGALDDINTIIRRKFVGCNLS